MFLPSGVNANGLSALGSSVLRLGLRNKEGSSEELKLVISKPDSLLTSVTGGYVCGYDKMAAHGGSTAAYVGDIYQLPKFSAAIRPVTKEKTDLANMWLVSHLN